MTSVAETIFLYGENDELVSLASLTEKEQDDVKEEFDFRMMVGFMTAFGYKLVGGNYKKEELGRKGD